MRIFRRSSRRRRAPLPWPVRLFCFVLTWAPPLVLLVLGARTVLRHLDAVLAQAAPLASAEASRALEREVRIGKLSPDFSVRSLWEMARNLSGLETLSIEAQDVAIANETTIAASGALATAPRVTLSVSVPRLLAGDTSGAIPSIRVEGADVLLVRRPDGRFNVQDLIRPPKKPAARPFRTRVVLENGRITLRDFAARFSRQRLPAENHLAGVNGTVDLMERSIRFDVTARARQNTPTAARLGGSLVLGGSLPRGDDPAPGSARALVSVRAGDALAPYWLDYLFDLRDPDITAGRADADLLLALPRPEREGAPAPPIQFSGTMRLRRGRVVAERLPAPLENVWADVRLTRGAARGEVRAALWNETVSARGTLWNLFVGPGEGPIQLALDVSAPRVPVGRAVRSYFPLPPGLAVGGMGAVAATVHGSLGDPVVSGRVRIPGVTFRGVAASDVRANVTYARGLVTATEASARVAGARASGRAAFRFAEIAADGTTRPLPAPRRQAAFTAKVSGANLVQLPIVGGSPLRGGGDLEVVGQLAAGKLTAAANVVARNARFRDIAIPDARARVLFADGRITVPGLSALSSAGAARVAGSVAPDGRLDLRVNAAGLDVGRIARALGRRDVQGIAYVNGNVQGTLRDPVLLASVRVLEPGYGTYRADIATGSVRASRTRIALGEDVVIRRFPATATVAGAVAIGGAAPRLDLVVRASELPLTEILRQVGQDVRRLPPILGVVERATVRLSGTPARPRITGEARLGETLVSEYTIEGGSLNFSLIGGTTDVARAEITVRDVGTLHASARIAPDGRLAGAFNSPGINVGFLSAFTRRFATIEGQVGLKGRLSGTIANPVVGATLTSSGVQVAGTPLTDVAAEVAYVANPQAGEGRISVPSFSFRQGGSVFRARNAVYAQSTGRFSVALGLETGDIAVLLDTIRRSGFADTEIGRSMVGALNGLPQPISGRFALSDVAVSGRVTPGGIEERALRGALQASDVQVGGVELDTISTRISLDENRIVLEEPLTLVHDPTDTTIVVRGGADLDGSIDVVLEASNASLDLVKAFAPAARVEGRVDLTVRARGQTRMPEVTASLQGSDVAFGGVRFSLLRAESVSLRPTGQGTVGEIDLSEILIQRNVYRATLTGTLPFSYATYSIPPNEPIALRAAARSLDLDVLTAFEPGISPESVAGTLDAQLDVGGTLADRRLSGFLRVTDGRFTPPRTPGEDRDRFNPISDLNVDIGFEGDRVAFRRFELVPGGPNGRRGDFGRLLIRGGIDLSTLEIGQTPGAPARPDRPVRGGALDLTVEFRGLRPVLENLLNRGMAAEARINGVIRVTGPLDRPRIATPGPPTVAATPGSPTPPAAQAAAGEPAQPLVISDALLRPPTRPAVEGGEEAAYPIAPFFDIRAVIDRRAVVDGGAYRIEADGSATLQGRLGRTQRPNALANLQILGGHLRFPTARFVLQKGARIFVAFRPQSESTVSVSDLVARATVYAPSGVAPSLALREDRSVYASASPFTTGGSRRYRITAEFNGTTRLGEEGLDPKNLNFTFTADPPLSQSQIVSLLAGQQQIEQAARGDVEGALRQQFASVFSSTFVPTLLSPVEESVATALSLEQFSLEYNPDAPLTLFLQKRLPDPFERFLLSYTRTVGARQTPGLPDPQELRLFYEVGPRFQIGIFTDEQREQTLFLQGTRSF